MTTIPTKEELAAEAAALRRCYNPRLLHLLPCRGASYQGMRESIWGQNRIRDHECEGCGQVKGLSIKKEQPLGPSMNMAWVNVPRVQVGRRTSDERITIELGAKLSF